MSLKKLSSKPSPKQALVLVMLKRKQGASIFAVMKATGWQRHSVRGFDGGGAHQALTLVSWKTGKERVYRIVANDVSPFWSSRNAASGAAVRTTS